MYYFQDKDYVYCSIYVLVVLELYYIVFFLCLLGYFCGKFLCILLFVFEYFVYILWNIIELIKKENVSLNIYFLQFRNYICLMMRYEFCCLFLVMLCGVVVFNFLLC